MSAGLIEVVTALATVFSSVVAQTSSDGGSGWLLLAGPAAGGGLYFLIFRYYRNTNKSHSFEQEAKIASQPVTGSDAKVDEVRGTQRSSVPGNNVRQFRDRVQRVQ